MLGNNHNIPNSFHDYVYEEQTEVRECLLSFGAELQGNMQREGRVFGGS